MDHSRSLVITWHPVETLTLHTHFIYLISVCNFHLSWNSNPTRKPVRRSVKFSKPWDECITYEFTAHVSNELKLKRKVFEGNESTLKRFPNHTVGAPLIWAHDPVTV